MNQHFNHEGDEQMDELEKQLAQTSLISPSSDYDKLAQRLRADSNNARPWPWFAIPALAVVMAVYAAVSFLPADTDDAATLPVASFEDENDSIATADEQLFASSTESPFREGTHYTELNSPLDMSDSTTTEVVVFFWYPCRPCGEFDEHLRDWAQKLPADVTLVRIPTIWSEEMRFPARAYYTAQSLGMLEQVHQAFYSAFLKDEATITSELELQLFLQGLGVSPARFSAVYHSPEILDQVESAVQSNRSYEVRSTPTIFVHGQYRVDGLPGGHAEMLEIIDHLILRVQGEA